MPVPIFRLLTYFYMLRIEKDFLGEKEIPKDALYGIHSVRARENFPGEHIFHAEWYQAIALVKKAVYLTVKDYIAALESKGLLKNYPLRLIGADKLAALTQSAEQVANGMHFNDFIVPAISGGAGTSINMNMNEIIANNALVILGHEPGQSNLLDPIEDANVFQSTNDVVPTALKLAVMQLLPKMESSITC
ncbi:MAG: hypothetical protein HC896_02860 [Bacteroidales bacterium]|nr:hypothetical protein [Bacteroidales bacterium]